MSDLNWREKENEELLREGKAIVKWEEECKKIQRKRREWVLYLPEVFSLYLGFISAAIIFSFVHLFILPASIISLGIWVWIDWIRTKKLFPFPEYESPKQIEAVKQKPSAERNYLKNWEREVFGYMPPPLGYEMLISPYEKIDWLANNSQEKMPPWLKYDGY